MKLDLESNWSRPFAEPYRKLAAIGVALVCCATIVLGAQSIRDRGRQDQIDLEQQLQAELAGLEDRYRASAQRFEDSVSKLRLEIRAQAIWDQHGLRPDVTGDARFVDSTQDPVIEPVETSQASQLRRLDGLLRQRLMDLPHVRRLELIVASHDGLWGRRYVPNSDDAPNSGRAVTTRSLSEAATRDLWFQPGLQQAVAASGRNLDWSELAWETGGETEPPRPVQHIGIAIHENGDVIQGALVLVIDMTAWTAELEQPRFAATNVRITDANGRALTTATGPDLDPDQPRAPSLETVLHLDAHPKALAMASVSSAPMPSTWLAQTVVPQTLALVLIGLLGSICSVRLVYPTEYVTRYEATALDPPKSVDPPAEAVPSEAPPQDTFTAEPLIEEAQPVIAPEPIQEAVSTSRKANPRSVVLRDWLSDVRACLERKAAMQGLDLEVACEHTLPEDVDTDPVALGAILVSIGTQALAATRNQKVSLIVRSDAEHADTLRFEIDGGGVDLPLSASTEALLAELGGHREPSATSDLSLVVAA